MKIKDLDQNTAFASGSLFSGGGLGDVGIEWGAGVPVIAASELVPSRAALLRANFTNTKVFEGDICREKDHYISYCKKKLAGKKPWLLTLSPPCQGMSSNGAGKLSAAVKAGNRSSEDPRNRLILPGIDIVAKLQPDWFVLENVRRMENTIIRNERNRPENILSCLSRRLHPLGYTIRANILDFRAYGVPHHRERLITIGCRIPGVVSSVSPIEPIYSTCLSPLHPIPTHGPMCNLPYVSLRDAIGHLPALDARTKLSDSEDPYHCIPPWNEKQYFWMRHTPEGQTAFDNLQCPDCQKIASNPIAVRCSCGTSLPRPQKEVKGRSRLVHGFRSSYRRMNWNKPASTLTMNSGVISSDVKGHPVQNRVLSLREILILSTLDHPLWKDRFTFRGIPFGRMKKNELFSKKLIREVVGESIPPLAMLKIIERLKQLDPRVCK